MFHHLLTLLIKIGKALWRTHSHFLHAFFLLVTRVPISRQWSANDSAPTSERNNKIDCQSENGFWFSWLTSENSPWNLLSIYYAVQWSSYSVNQIQCHSIPSSLPSQTMRRSPIFNIHSVYLFTGNIFCRARYSLASRAEMSQSIGYEFLPSLLTVRAFLS